MFSHEKNTSRERLMGISFIDILIQAIFLLFLGMTVGYMDPTDKEYTQLGKDMCIRINKDSVKACRDNLEKGIGYLKKEGFFIPPCIEQNDGSHTILSARFKVHSPNSIRFEGFTADYKKYLAKKGMLEKLKKANTINLGLYSVDSIRHTFGFMKEKSCRHQIIKRMWEGSWRYSELRTAFSVLDALHEPKQE